MVSMEQATSVMIKHKNVARTIYQLDGSEVRITDKQKLFLLGLLECCPLIGRLRIQDKQIVKRLRQMHLIRLNGDLPYNGVLGIENKFVSLTKQGQALARFIKGPQ